MPNISRPFISSPLASHPPPWPVSAASHLWKWRSRLVSEPKPGSCSASGSASCTNSITVVCISDTHNTQPYIPPHGDILLHAGDLSVYGTFKELKSALEWISTLPQRHKVVVAGNHDLLLDRAFAAKHPDRELLRPGETAADLPWNDGEITYLENAATTIEVASSFSGGEMITMYGSPLIPQHGNFAFQYSRGSTDVWRKTVPPGNDVLLTHGPPQGHLDEDRMGGVRFCWRRSGGRGRSWWWLGISTAGEGGRF